MTNNTSESRDFSKGIEKFYDGLGGGLLATGMGLMAYFTFAGFTQLIKTV